MTIMNNAGKRCSVNFRKYFVLTFLLIIVLCGTATAAIYRWTPSSGVSVATGVSTNWGACGALPSTFVTTLLTNGSSTGCATDRHGSAALDPAVDMFFNTAYTQNTNVQGNWYFGRLRDSTSGGGTFTFRLIYVYSNGTIVVLPGSASQAVSSGQSADFNVSLTGISGTVPAGAKLGLRISKSGSSTSLRAYVGDTANVAGTGPSGYFSVTETPAGQSNTYNVNLRSSPTTSSIAAGVNYTYTIYVNNTGNSNGNYTLSVTDSDSTNFTTPSVLGRTSIYVPAGGSNSTTLKVTAKLSGAGGAVDTATVTAISIENPSYTNSTTSVTTIQSAPAPGVSVSLTPSSQSVNKGGQVQYTVTVTNTGTVSDSYTLSLNNGNTANFSYSLAQTSTGTLNPGAQFVTTMTVTASAGASAGASHTQSVRAAGSATADSGIVTTIVAGGGKVIVAANRYVILDDPISTGKTAQTAAGFGLPWSGSSSWGLNSWTGSQTTITGYALVLSETGTPVSNTPVVFTIRNWNSADQTTSTAVNTNANGIASYALNLNAKNYYGNWYIDANATSYGTDTTGFIYNWWGCNAGGCRNHASNSPGTGSSTITNSPYTLGRETITANGNHASITDTGCAGCHRSYGGNGSGTQFSGQPTKTADVHNTDTCATCHATINTHNTNEPIKSCPDCHSWANLTREYTMSGGTPSVSNYSGNVAAAGHNPASTVPCIICHGPMHNITKPDETLRLANNDITEDSNCLACHTTYNKHNGGVGCTLCHSQDAHDIKVFSQSANYVSKGNTYQGNCTNCHQNATFINALKLAPKAGAYTGPNPPQVQKPLNHSNDTSAGQKWNNYWTSGTGGSAQLTACNYCHGSTQHDLNALGRPSQFDGNNIVGSTISNTTYWCSSCHWQGYASGSNNYNDMVNAFISLIVPPEITGHSTYGANQSKLGYFNHSSVAKDDASCQGCHGSLTQSTNITGLLHNTAQGSSGGPDCKSCHDIGGSAPKEIDINVLKNSTHKNLNGALTDVNKACYACHGDGSAPSSGHPLNYKNPKLCADCHTGAGNYSAPSVKEHNQFGQDVITNASCNLCHSNNGMFLPNSGTNGMTTAFVHYIKDITNRSTNPYQHLGPINTSNCVLCHNGAYTGNSSWGTPVNISTSTKRSHSETQTTQCDSCHKDGTVGSLAQVDFHNASVQLASTSDCLSCHTVTQGTYPGINSAAFGNHKNVNSTGGTNTLNNDDCTTCHYNFNYSAMSQPGFTTNTRVCTDCHTSGTGGAPIISNHKPGGVNISTAAYCSNCHNNSVSQYAFGQNASVGHYGTKTALIATADCTNCHKDPVNASIWGNALDPASSGTFPHSIATSTKDDCYACHNSAADFHNISLQKPLVTSVTCLDCHKTTATMAPKKIDESVIGSGSHSTQTCTTCHANASNTNMNTYSFASDPARTCQQCHTGSGSPGAPLVSEHNQNGQDILTSASCTVCHSNSGMYLTNTGTNGSTTAITHYIKDVTNMAGLPYLHLGPINTSNCVLCHNGAYTGNSSWGTPVNISTSTKRSHSETQTTQCDSCHKDGTVGSLAQVDFHNASLQKSDINNCLGCHTTVTSVDLGLHSGLNGTTDVENGDCRTCHFGSFQMVKGAVNNSNTYFCYDCHNQTSGGQAPAQFRSSIKFTDKLHGEAACMDCHAADGTYHQDNPRGSVANLTYVNRYPTTNTNTTDCADCHRAANLDDAPFNAPGGGSHIGESCVSGGCHGPSGSVVQVVHRVNSQDSKKPDISIPTLDQSTVTSGTDVNVSASVNFTLSPAYTYALVDGAQYRIMEGASEVRPWTPMTASDGNFNSILETATARIDTNGLAGTYSIEVRGMGGGPSQNPAVRYSPMNGDISTTQAVTLTVQTPQGYINGTVKNAGGTALSGVTVTTAGASDVTGADGSYSLMLPEGVYNVTASRQPVYIDNTISGIAVTPGNTTAGNITLVEKPKGTISGTIMSV